MQYHFNKYVKLGLLSAIITLMLTGCGASSKEEQSTWLELWNARYESKVKMLDACFKEAGVPLDAKQITSEQNSMSSECELNYITAAAKKDGITLDKKMIEDSIYQLRF